LPRSSDRNLLVLAWLVDFDHEREHEHEHEHEHE
jgi:hypothetical protein